MRYYYIGESEGPTIYAATALGVDAESWSSLAEHVLEWRWVMEYDYRVPSGSTLQGADLLAGAGNPFALGHLRPWPDPERGAEIMMNALRILEHAAWLRGSMKLINVCLGKGRHRDLRAAVRHRLLDRIEASAAADGRYACVMENGEEPEWRHDPDAGSVGSILAHGTPLRRRSVGGGRVAQDTAIPAPSHRLPGDDELLQLAGLVSYSLLQQEEPTPTAEALNFHLAFGILKSVLDRRASPLDPQGVVRL